MTRNIHNRLNDLRSRAMSVDYDNKAEIVSILAELIEEVQKLAHSVSHLNTLTADE